VFPPPISFSAADINHRYPQYKQSVSLSRIIVFINHVILFTIVTFTLHYNSKMAAAPYNVDHIIDQLHLKTEASAKGIGDGGVGFGDD
jgi:hypothetical protein